LLTNDRVLAERDVVALEVVVKDPQQDTGAALVEHLNLEQIA
jgi:hypothetical protein